MLMNKRRIILLSLLLGLAIALLGVLLMIMLGQDRGTAPAAEAQPSLASVLRTEELAPTPTEEPVPTPTEDPRLLLSSGPVDRNVTELILESVTEADLPLIRELANLTRLDGRACENEALLHAFSETVSYPVLWSVALGDARVDSDTVELTVPAAVSTAEEVAAALAELPQVQKVDLLQSGLSAEQVTVLRGLRPELEYLYVVTEQGASDGEAVQILELNATAATDWAAIAQQIALLPDLKQIVVSGALTPEQAAYLLEGAGGISAVYSVSFQGRTISTEDTEVDFSDLPASRLGDIKAVLTVLPNIQKVNLDPKSGSSKWTLEEADQLQTFRDGLLVGYTCTDKSLGVTFSLSDEVVTFKKRIAKRKLEELKTLLSYMRNVKRADMENCGLDNETMADLRDQYPQPKIVWRVKVGGYSVRTDAWMIKFSAGGGKKLLDKDVGNLKYCREIRYLDLGHNGLHHMDFVSYMPDLEVCIMLNPMVNIKGVENCPKLEYFECFSGMLKDLSPLAACTELKHLNICYNHITDMTALYGLTKLERLWISRNDIPKSQLNTFRELVPDCVVNTEIHDPTSGGWRKDETGAEVPRYVLLREQFRYDYTQLRSYGENWWDDGKTNSGALPPVKSKNN